MINCPLATAILMIRSFLISHASPTTLLLYMIVIPAVFAFVVFSYVRKEAAEDEEEEMMSNDRSSYSSAISTREWLAQRYVPCALEEAVVESIPLVKFFHPDAATEPASSMSSSSCVVCLTPFQEDEELKVLPPCQHAFHPLCIDPWFETHSTCPVCRSEVTPPLAPPLAKAGGSENEEGFASSCHELKHVPLIQVMVE